MSKPLLLCLVGPTAAGKSRMAVEVASDLRCRSYAPEIVSCDSMAVYRSLDIVADKPAAAERGGIPHHLFDVVDPSEPFTAATYRRLARGAIDAILARGGTPMLVGGSGLYFRAVVDELAFAPTSPEVRRRLEEVDPALLYARLEREDPVTARRLDPRNARRVVRALEILELTGRPPSELRTSWERGGGPYEVAVAGLTWVRPELLRRATERVDREIAAGLLEEVARVDNFSRTAAQALGVKEMLPVLEGREDLASARERLVRNTKSFVRRQLTWFRADPRVRWFNASALGWEGARRAMTEYFLAALGRRDLPPPRPSDGYL